MDNYLSALIHDSLPKFNDRIVNGMAVQELKYVEPYVHRIIQTAAMDFPPGLTYEGYRRCTPQEEVAEITRRSSNQSTHDLAPSYVYMVKFFFKFNGEDLDARPMYMPYVTDGGLMMLRGSTFAISPVLADKAISVGPDNIFVPLNRDKLTFQRLFHHYLRNGERETIYVVWAAMHHKSKAKGGAGRFAVRAKTALAHYLFAKFGLTHTFQRFANAEVVAGDESVVNEKTYPPEQWTICGSSRMKPKGVRDRFYRSTNIRLAVRNEQFNRVTSDLIGGFFYVVDHFPDRFEAEYLDETRLWIVTLGHLLFGSESNEGKLAEEVMSHLRSLDGYVDNEARSYLRSDGVYCEDLYDLLMHIIETFNQRVTHSGQQVASMWDKRLMVLRYVLKDVTTSINKFMFAVSGPKKKPLNKAEINMLLKKYLKTNKIMSISMMHGEVSSVSSPGDNKFFKVTCTLIPQTDSSGGRGKSKAEASDPGKLFDVSLAECGSYSTPTKSEPTGRNRINPFIHVHEDGLIVRDPNKRELLDSVARITKR